MVSAMIEAVGVDQASYPFDDIFSSIPIFLQCLEDDFQVFLDRENYIALKNPTDWIQRFYRDVFGQEMTFAHHDMALATNMASFERKVARFRAIRPEDNPLFVHFNYADRMPAGDEFCRLRRQLGARFGRCTLLVVSFGPEEPNVQGWNHPGIIFRHRILGANSRIEGVAFTDPEDNAAVKAFINEAIELTARGVR